MVKNYTLAVDRFRPFFLYFSLESPQLKAVDILIDDFPQQQKLIMNNTLPNAPYTYSINLLRVNPGFAIERKGSRVKPARVKLRQKVELISCSNTQPEEIERGRPSRGRLRRRSRFGCSSFVF
ncbi:hypothetical protein EVAR_93211_1 [Eumeta japonica]|uniref:Uncharacterized protein n=1 Tax=Eumeta variegata TaxID=151549 RepID=A0A4C1TXJ7_EUMVA|nr:hypothetical protein EVAR_93211_1 [Eumeta japonica]